MHNMQNYANNLYWQFTSIGDQLAIAQELISDILTCFAADVLDRAPQSLAAEAPHMGALQHHYIYRYVL